MTPSAVTTGRRRGSRRTPTRLGVHPLTIAGLVLALVASAVVLALRPPGRAAAPNRPPGALAGLGEVWRQAKVTTMPGRLGDGRAYQPWFFIDATTSVGTAITGDATRLVVRDPNGAAREIQRLSDDGNPQFNSFATAGDELIWMVAVSDAEGRATTALYKADWRRGTPAVKLTDDTGDALFFNSQYDLVVAEGRIRWVAAARTESPVTELRSIPLAGGTVTTQRIEGAWAHSAWPLLTSFGSGQAGPVDVIDAATGARRTVPAASNELVTCGPIWCRVVILGATGSAARIDVMRLDGSGRQRIVGGGSVTPAVVDVALAGRFEVLSRANPVESASGSIKLMLHDITTDRTVVVAPAVATVLARGTVLWWSTGEAEATEWHVLDLAGLG